MGTFNPSSIRVFDRSGSPLGELIKFHIVQPRSYRLNEIEDFTFEIPRKDDAGQILGTTEVDLLKRDNLVFVQNEITSMPGWAGAITDVTFGNDRVNVRVLGAASLLMQLETELIEQTEGLVYQIAQRLVAAAQAKQAAHGDLVVQFQTPMAIAFGDTAKQNYGKFSYEGDIFAGLQQLAESSSSEFQMISKIGTDGRLSISLLWATAGRFYGDFTSKVTFKDGVGGQIEPGTEVLYTVQDIANRVRLKGSATSLESYLDYDCVKSIVKNITPTVELILDNTDSPNHRRREILDLSVGFGYSETKQQDLARTIQDRYLAYYKRFLYAYHNVRGRPFLDGYEWGGPDGTNDKQLIERYYRTYQRLGLIGQRTIITGDSSNDSVDAAIENWKFNRTASITGDMVGIAVDYTNPSQKFIASSDGNIYLLTDEATTAYDTWQSVTAGGETLKGVATDAGLTSSIWCLLIAGSVARIKQYSINSKALISQYDIAGGSLINDIAVDAALGELYCVANDGVGNLQIRDINSGIEITGTGGSFASGFTNPTGVSVTGGIAYIINGSGEIRMMFVEDGNFAANFSSGVSAAGIFTDTADGEIWIVKTNGDAAVYDANVAVATVPDPGSAAGAPGFDEIQAGQFVHIVATGDRAYGTPTNKLVIVYAPGKYVTEVTETDIGTLNTIERIWTTEDTKVGFSDTTKVQMVDVAIVIQGEESRVCDWTPKTDGYGVHVTQYWRARGNRYVNGGYNWWFREWDIPDSYFEVEAPAWPEGEEYLQKWLQQNNKERTVVTFRIANVDNVWAQIRLGGQYLFNLSNQGGPSGITGTIRVTSFEPDDLQGTMTVQGEFV